MASGDFRFIGWAVPHGSDEAHAYPQHGVQFAPMCNDPRWRWDVRARRVRPSDAAVPELCLACVLAVSLVRELMGRDVEDLVAAHGRQITPLEAAS